MKKNFFLLLLALCLCVPAWGQSTLKGDLDEDGRVTPADISCLVDYLLNGFWPDRPVIYVRGMGFEMALVKGGPFMMGATPEQGNDSWYDEKPVHEVTLDDFYIGVTEVTQSLWDAVMGINPSDFKNPVKPVERVSWNDCQVFIDSLNKLTGKHFRLPTEAEWEYAARGGRFSQGYKFAGSNTLDQVGWYIDNVPGESYEDEGYSTQFVAVKQPNELGLYDMSGNVWEFCQDWYENYYYEKSPSVNPTGPETGSYRVIRGGSWYHSEGNSRVSMRGHTDPNNMYNSYGLRLVMDL